MDNPQGRVLAVHSDDRPAHAVVEVAESFRCARCASGRGCGAGVFATGGPRQVEALLLPGVTVGTGDEVRLELAPDNVLRAAGIVYGLPLLGAGIGAAMAWGAGAGDAGASLLALLGLGAGFLLGRRRLSQASCLRRFTPTITARVGSADG